MGIHTIDAQIQASPQQIIRQAAVRQKTMLGWIVIAMFVLQNALTLLTTLAQAIPVLSYILLGLIWPKIVETVRSCLNRPSLLKITYAVMHCMPWLFPFLPKDLKDRPIENIVLELESALRLNRMLYHQHRHYLMPLAHILSVPTALVTHYLIRGAESAAVYTLFDYLIIVNNLNPRTFAYERASPQQPKFLWVFHDSNGEQFQSQLLELEQRKDFLQCILDSVVCLAGRSSRSTRLYRQIALTPSTTDLNKLYSEGMLE